MHLLILLVEICALGFVTISARPREMNRQPENENQPGHFSLNQNIANLNINSEDEQLHGIVKNVELNQGTNNQLSERINEKTDTNLVKHVVNEQNTESDPVETHVDNVYNDGNKLEDREQLQNSIPTSPKAVESVSLNPDNEKDSKAFNSTRHLLSSVNELKHIAGHTLDYETEVRKEEKQKTMTSIDKADENPPDQYIHGTNDANAISETEEKQDEDDHIPDTNVFVNEAANAEQRFPNNLEQEKVLISKELSEKSSVHSKGHDFDTDVDNGPQLPSETVEKATTEDDMINVEKANEEEITTPITVKAISEEVSSKNIIKLGKQVIPPQDVTLVNTEVTISQNIINTVSKETSENNIYRKNNEEISTSTERNISKGVDDSNDKLNHRVHSATTRASEEIKHKHDINTTNKETHELNHDSLFVTSEASDTKGKSNSNTPANSVDSGSSLTKTAVRKETTTTAIKQKPVNDTPLSFHSLKENVKLRSTKQSSIPAKKPIQSAKAVETSSNTLDISGESVETSSNKLDMSGGYVEETEYKVDEDLKQKDDKPCECMGDSEQMYTASALIASTVGGVFIGVFVILLLFNARDKCKRYVHGDYRRVPMEYDFEMNPRLKTH